MARITDGWKDEQIRDFLERTRREVLMNMRSSALRALEPLSHTSILLNHSKRYIYCQLIFDMMIWCARILILIKTRCLIIFDL